MEGSTPTLEQVLARLTAQNEALQAENATMKEQLGLSQSAIDEQAKVNHTSTVREKVRALNGKLPPVVVLAAKSLYEADFHAPSQEPASLNLSATVAVQKTDDEGKATWDAEERKFESATEIVDFLLAQFPQGTFELPDYSDEEAASLSLAKAPEGDKQTAEEAADEIERTTHPERFENDGKGKRIEKAEATK